MAHPSSRSAGRSAAIVLAAIVAATLARPAAAAGEPPIRISSSSRVPACVTPERLMQFLKSRNQTLDPRFKDIALHYKRHGEAWKVRWDFAFYQMAIETNFLTFRAPSGRPGDVDPRQNNFAGIGATGGGVPGDSFPDVSTGVLAQIQHLVVYSGERVDRPVAPRTQLKQQVILDASAPIAAQRPLTFQDLSGRWAVDRSYGRSIQWVADRFASQFCQRSDAATGGDTAGRHAATAEPAAPHLPRLDSKRRSQSYAAAEQAAAADPAKSSLAGPAKKPAASTEDGGVAVARTFVPLPVGPGMAIARQAIDDQRSTANPERSRLASWAAPVKLGSADVSAGGAAVAPVCPVENGSFGGQRIAVIRSVAGSRVQVTLLTVVAGFERSMTQGALATMPDGATVVGIFDAQEEARQRARDLCAGPR